LFIYDLIDDIFMKTTSKKTLSDKLKKVRVEKKTDEEFPPSKGIHKRSELPKKPTKENHIKQFNKL